MSEEAKETKPLNAQLHDKFWENFVVRSHLKEFIDECQNFYNGNQWPDDGNVDNFPRPTLNVCSYSSNLKASKVVGTPIYFAISSNKESQDCTKLRQFDEYMQSKLDMKSFGFQSCLNGFNNGTEVVYYRWDLDDETAMGIYKGGLAVEHIDPRNFAVANPFQPNIQKQKWVMFWTDIDISAAKEILGKENFSKEEIDEAEKKLVRESFGEHFDDTTKDKDIINHGLVRVYTRFYRYDGEVFFDCSTDKVELYKNPHPMSTVVNASVAAKIKVKDATDGAEWIKDADGDLTADLNIDPEDASIGDSPSKLNTFEAHKENSEKWSLYPFAVYKPYVINNSFYGRSDIHDFIQFQKTINFCLAMITQCAQNNAFNKILVKEGALAGQKVTNAPSQVLVDHSQFANGWGIKFAESQPMPNDLINFVGSLLSFGSKYGGFSDVMGGNVSNQDISGYAVQQMIKQANTPIEQQQQLFWSFQVQQFYIRLLFYKFYIDKANYTFELTDGEMEEQETARQTLISGHKAGLQFFNNDGSQMNDAETKQAMSFLNIPTRRTQLRELTKDDIFGIDFDIRVDAQQGLADTKLTEEQFWDNLLLNGGISKMEPDVLEFYIKVSPSIPAQAKDNAIRLAGNLKRGQIAMLKNQVQQAMSVIQQKDQIIGELSNKLKVSDDFNKNLTNEFKQRLAAAGRMNDYKDQTIAMLKKNMGVSQGEGKSLNSRGISGTNIAPEQMTTDTVQ